MYGMSFENSGLNGDVPVKADLIGATAFRNPHSLAFGDLVQGHASRSQNDWNGGKFPKPSDMKIISVIPPMRSFGQCSFLLRISTLEGGRPEIWSLRE
jgi:hypothetical protein